MLTCRTRQVFFVDEPQKSPILPPFGPTMMDILWTDIGLAVLAALAAGIVDAIAGGGGLVTVPILFVLFPHWHHTQVIATNRLSSVAGTALAAANYLRAVRVHWWIVGLAGLAAVLTAYAGSWLLGRIDSSMFKPLLLICMVLLAFYTFLKKDLGAVEQPARSFGKMLGIAALIGMFTGFYNGFIGPGTGSLLMFAFVAVAGLDFVRASAHAKIVNVLGDLASLAALLMQDAIVWQVAVPMMLANMLGGYLGSRLAILKGNQLVRKVFIGIILLVIARFGWDVLN